MELLDEHLLLSARDLVNFLECEHLTTLDLEKAHGRLDSAPKRPDTVEVLTQKGKEHEQRHLELLRERYGDALVEIEAPAGHEGLLTAAQATEEAVRAGAPVIYQPALVHERWRGHANFLKRVKRPSCLGA